MTVSTIDLAFVARVLVARALGLFAPLGPVAALLGAAIVNVLTWLLVG